MAIAYGPVDGVARAHRSAIVSDRKPATFHGISLLSGVWFGGFSVVLV